MPLGTPTGAPNRNADPPPRAQARFACPTGHEFTVTFSADAETPADWRCPRHGVEHCPHTHNHPDRQPAEPRRPPTHYGKLLERRSQQDLDTLLEQALAGLQHQRRSPYEPVPIGNRTYNYRFHP
ncbi:RNA polymerase-binding protein RbpA [Actinokineospora sp. NPDC004072]